MVARTNTPVPVHKGAGDSLVEGQGAVEARRMGHKGLEDTNVDPAVHGDPGEPVEPVDPEVLVGNSPVPAGYMVDNNLELGEELARPAGEGSACHNCHTQAVGAAVRLSGKSHYIPAEGNATAPEAEAEVQLEVAAVQGESSG